jgi:hypothetical protein
MNATPDQITAIIAGLIALIGALSAAYIGIKNATASGTTKALNAADIPKKLDGANERADAAVIAAQEERRQFAETLRTVMADADAKQIAAVLAATAPPRETEGQG